MKIFISHSSKNKFFGDNLVELLRGVGIKENEIIFTSNPAYGIPVGQNIFNWLKSQIEEKPFVIYLLSDEYYQSIACLNEMGAAWVVENKHVAIFTPKFDLLSKEFQSGALDPREIGFYITDEERILSFLDLISEDFDISKKQIIISQSVKKFLNKINNNNNEVIKEKIDQEIRKQEVHAVIRGVEQAKSGNLISAISTEVFSKFSDLILKKKLNDGELILLYYIINTGRFRLMTGWQEERQIEFIKEWEVINEIENILSRNYSAVINRFEMRGFTDVSAVTSSNNPKEIKIKDEICQHILNLPDNILNIIMETVKKSHYEYPNNIINGIDNLPF